MEFPLNSWERISPCRNILAIIKDLHTLFFPPNLDHSNPIYHNKMHFHLINKEFGGRGTGEVGYSDLSNEINSIYNIFN